MRQAGLRELEGLPRVAELRLAGAAGVRAIPPGEGILASEASQPTHKEQGP